MKMTPTKRKSLLVSAMLSALAIVSSFLNCAYGTSSHAHRLFDVISPGGALFSQGAGSKTITLDVNNKQVRELHVAVVPITLYDQESALSHITENVSGSGKARIHFTVPNRGLFNLHVVADNASGQSIGSQDVAFAALESQSAEPIDSMGINIHYRRNRKTIPESLELVRKAGFGRIRDELPWNNVEKKPGQFSYPNGFDDYIDKANQLGIKPLLILGYANTRAYKDLFSKSRTFPTTHRQVGHFKNYVAKTVEHYRGKIDEWELWNEPHFTKKLSIANYAGLLKTTHKAAKRANSNAQVIACGGGGAGGGPGGDCITQLLKAGVGKYIDGFSIHPYMGATNAPGVGYSPKHGPLKHVNVPTVWPYMARLIKHNRHKMPSDVSLWVTEIGWYTSPIKKLHPALMQAAYFTQLYLLSRRYADAKAVFWFNFKDNGHNPKDREHHFGLITDRYEPKPSYVAAVTLAHTLGNRVWARTLSEKSNKRIEQYGRGGNAVIAAWTTGKQRKTTLRLPEGHYILRRWDGSETPVRMTGRGISLEVGSLPTYILRADGP